MHRPCYLAWGGFLWVTAMLLSVGIVRLLPENRVRDLIPVNKRWTDQVVLDA